MDRNYCHNLLEAEGYKLLGYLDYDFSIELWWDPELNQEFSLVYIDPWIILRGTKQYRLTSRSDSELFARELKMFDNYLFSHYDEMHLSISAFPHISSNLSQRKISEMNNRNVSDNNLPSEELAKIFEKLSEEISDLEVSLRGDIDLFKLNNTKAGLLNNYIQNQITQKRRQLEKLRLEKKTLRKKLISNEHINKQYLKKAEGTAILFTTSSNLQIVKDETSFLDAIDSIRRELENVERFELKQKLMGGKLKVFVESVSSPAISLMTRWVRAVLDPRQLARQDSDCSALCKAVEDQIAVFSNEDILLDGSTKEEKKLVNARVVKNFLEKLKVVPAAPIKTEHLKTKMPIWLGNNLEGDTRVGQPWELPLEKAGHIYVSGMTGSGKTFFAFSFIEGARTYENLAIVIVTPNNQWAGLLRKEDRQEILGQYSPFGLKADMSRSFDFKYYGVGQGIGESLPKDLRLLATGFHIISLKGLYDHDRCKTTADILQSLFNARSQSESSQPRLIVVIDEARRFTRRFVEKEAQASAAEAERAIDLITAEARKYGVLLMLLTQGAKYFSYNLTTIRQNMITHVFMLNGKEEMNYAEYFIEDSKDILQLKIGQAILCNPHWGITKIAVRPPLSKPWEPDHKQVKKLVGSVNKAHSILSKEAQAVLDTAYEQYRQTGEAPKFAFIAEQLGITSRRKLNHIVEELQKSSSAKFERLQERGKPLVIIPTIVQK